MRFHVLGVSHTRTTAEYSVCAFTQKTRHLCKMLHDNGHTVYHYGTEGSDPVCTEHVTVLDSATFARVHGAYDYRTEEFRISGTDEAYTTFTRNAIAAIRERVQVGDFLCCTFGMAHKPIADAVPQAITVESGIGYVETFAVHRVFESYAWMHLRYGSEDRYMAPRYYDAVIPNCVDLAQFCFRREKEDFHLFLGRPTALKGRDIAIRVCQELGIPLYVAGQGDRDVPAGVTHLGVLGPEERADWLSRAAALWCPTIYVEPFGTVAIEAMASGTPVIASDTGAFTETVVHGQTGWRCRTHEQFLWAAKHVARIDPLTCRWWAADNYSLERTGQMYEEYFRTLARLYDGTGDGWYAPNPDRLGLDWLRRYYP